MNLGQRTKLGGKPDWIQCEDVPECDECERRMTFVGQIDSIEHDSEHNPHRKNALGKRDYMFGDVGLIYVFYCFHCLEAKAFLQSY